MENESSPYFSERLQSGLGIGAESYNLGCILLFFAFLFASALCNHIFYKKISPQRRGDHRGNSEKERILFSSPFLLCVSVVTFVL
jgi:Na+/H+ antiporter NhaD/arsenite permease-like protein